MNVGHAVAKVILPNRLPATEVAPSCLAPGHPDPKWLFWRCGIQELAGSLHAGMLARLQLRPDGFIDYLQREAGFRLVRNVCMTRTHGMHLERRQPTLLIVAFNSMVAGCQHLHCECAKTM